MSPTISHPLPRSYSDLDDVAQGMAFPWPSEGMQDAPTPIVNQVGQYQHSLMAPAPHPPRTTKRSVFKKLTGMFRSSPTLAASPDPYPIETYDSPYLLSDEHQSPAFQPPHFRSSHEEFHAPPAPIVAAPRKSMSSMRGVFTPPSSPFLSSLFTRSQESLTAPPKRERNVLRKKGSAGELRSLRNGSTTSLVGTDTARRQLKPKKSGLAVEILPLPSKPVETPPQVVVDAPPCSQPPPPVEKDDTTSSPWLSPLPSPSSLPPTPSSVSSPPATPKSRPVSLRPPRTLSSLPPAPPSPTFPPPPPPVTGDDRPKRIDSIMQAPSSPRFAAAALPPPPPPPPPSVRVQQPHPESTYPRQEKTPSLASSSSGKQTQRSNGSGGGGSLPRLKDPFKEVRYRSGPMIDEAEFDDIIAGGAGAGIIKNWTQFGNESVEKFRAATLEPDNQVFVEEKKKGRARTPISSIFRKKRAAPPSPLTLGNQHRPPYTTLEPSSPSPLPSPLLLTPPPSSLSSPRPIVQSLEDIDIDDIENDTITKRTERRRMFL